MNSIQSSLFDTMKQFSEYSKKTSNATITIEGTIKEVVDAGVGEYLIEYYENSFSAYANPGTTYSAGDKVYVIVPDGDFTKTKIIISATSPQANIKINSSDDTYVYYELSDNFIDINLGIIELSSYETTRVENLHITDLTAAYANIINDFISKGNNLFRFTFNAKTNLAIPQRSGGNYGMTLSLPLITESAEGGGSTELIWKDYTLDVGNMLGDPYRLEAWSPQSLYFTIDPQYRISSKESPRLSYFCYDFNQDSFKITTKDIFLSYPALYIVDELSTTNNEGTSLVLTATQGNFFADNYDTVKTITPTLRINGNKTTIKTENENDKEYGIYWFVEDVSVKANSPTYCKYGGYGWSCLGEQVITSISDDGTENKEWEKDQLTLQISRDDILLATRYKCVVIYANTLIEKIITINNLNTSNLFELKQTDGYNTLLKNTGYVHLTAIVHLEDTNATVITNQEEYRKMIKYSWSRINKLGDLISDDDNFFEIVKENEIIDGNYVTEIKFPVNAVEEYNIINCTAKRFTTEKEILIGTRQLPISTVEETGFNVIINNDNIVYKYDSNGNSPTSSAYDGPAASKVNTIAPLTYNVYKPDGTELSPEEYCYVQYKWSVHINSLLNPRILSTSSDDYYNYYEGYDNYNHTISLPYELENRFSVQKSYYSEVLLEITFQGNTVKKVANITFIKDGMQGTNGTSYVVQLVAGGETYDSINNAPYGVLDNQGVAQKLKFLYNKSNEIFYRHNFRTNSLEVWDTVKNRNKIYAKVYRNGELLLPTQFEVKWEMFDALVTKPIFNTTPSEDGYGGHASVILDRNSEEIVDIEDYTDLNNPKIYNINIVQATVRVTGHDNDSGLNKQEEVIAYYPLELTVVDSLNFDITGNSIIPSMDGGFSEVMYASDGTNPQYDETNNFIINDDKLVKDNVHINDYFNITWEAQHHLTCSSVNGSNPMKIKADNKYDDGNNRNYVVSRLVFKDDKMQSIVAQIAETSRAIEYCQEDLIVLENNRNYLLQFKNDFHYNFWMNTIKNLIDILFKARTNGMSSLYLISNSITSLESYINDQRNFNHINITELDSAILDLKFNVVRARDAILKCDPDEVNFVDLQNQLIDYDESEFIELYGKEIAMQLKFYVENINSRINTYLGSYDELISIQSGTTYISTYNEIIDEVRQCFRNILLNSDLYDKYQNIFDYSQSEFENSIEDKWSLDSFKIIFNNIIRHLSTIYKYDNNGNILSLLNVEENFFINSRKNLQDKIGDYGTYLYELYNLKNSGESIQNTEIFHIRPIVLYFNRYEMSNVNGWDGNKIYTGNNDEFLLAPQVGAGQKELDNSFTGIIMGIRNIRASNSDPYQQQVGMFGYYKGTQSMFLNAKNGAAIFGTAGTGGQIIIDPTSTREKRALLYSSNYWRDYKIEDSLPISYNKYNETGEGTLIDLGKGSIHFANAFGCIYSGEHTNFESFNKGFYLSHNGLSITSEDKNSSISFATTGYPKIFAGGHSDLHSREIGFYLSQDGLSIGDKVLIKSTGLMKLGAGAVEENGRNTRHWTISAIENEELINSYISFNTDEWHQGNTSGGRDESVYIGTNGISLGRYFSVDSYGNLNATNVELTGKITATTGRIGGFNIVNGTDLIAGDEYIHFGIHVITGNGFLMEMGNMDRKWFPMAVDGSEPDKYDDQHHTTLFGHLGEGYFRLVAAKCPYTEETRTIISYTLCPLWTDDSQSPPPEIEHPEADGLYEEVYNPTTMKIEYVITHDATPMLFKRYYIQTTTVISDGHSLDKSENNGSIIADNQIISYTGFVAAPYIQPDTPRSEDPASEYYYLQRQIDILNGIIFMHTGANLYVENGYIDIVEGNLFIENGNIEVNNDIKAGHDLVYGNACYQSSDRRLKKDIKSLDDKAEDFIYSLNPVEFKFIADKKEKIHHGLIAQEVEDKVEENSSIINKTKDNMLAIDYIELIADLIKVVQNQNERIKILEEQRR